MGRGTKIALAVRGAVVLVSVIFGAAIASTYTSLVRFDQPAQTHWPSRANQSPRRADRLPTCVARAQGAANFEQSTLTAVTEARSRVGQVTTGAVENIARDAQAFARFQQAQDQLSSAVSRLMVVVERYPELKATQNFRELQAQL